MMNVIYVVAVVATHGAAADVVAVVDNDAFVTVVDVAAVACDAVDHDDPYDAVASADDAFVAVVELFYCYFPSSVDEEQHLAWHQIDSNCSFWHFYFHEMKVQRMTWMMTQSVAVALNC